MTNTLVPAREVFAKRKSRGDYWPKRGAGSRLGESCVPLISPKFDLRDCTTFFTIGSCFARNIEEYLQRAGLDVVSRGIVFPAYEMFPNQRPNELLVKYTPAAILAELEYALTDCSSKANFTPISDGKGEFYDPYIPMTYPAAPWERVIERRAEIKSIFARIATVDAVILTLGLIEDWYDAELGLFLNSGPTPKMVELDPDRYFFQILPFEENLRIVRRIMDLIHEANPSAKIVVTTSPVPLGRTFTSSDVLVANTFSKSTLRVISQIVAEERDYVDYFPSYEMVTLSGRDSSWEADQRHVLDSKVGQIMSTFMGHYLTNDSDIGRTAAAYLEAKRALEEKRFCEALRLLQELEQQLPNDEKVITDICQAALQLKEYDIVIEYSAMVPEDSLAFASVALARAQALVSTGNYAEATDLCQRLLETLPKLRVRARRWLMETARATGDFPLAKKHAEAALDIIASGDGNLPAAILARVISSASWVDGPSN